MEILVSTRTDVGEEKEQRRVYPPKKGWRKGREKRECEGTKGRESVKKQ